MALSLIKSSAVINNILFLYLLALGVLSLWYVKNPFVVVHRNIVLGMKNIGVIRPKTSPGNSILSDLFISFYKLNI